MRQFSFLGAVRRALAAVLALACSGPALSQQTELDLSPPSEAEIAERLEFLEQRLDAVQLHGQLWYWGWLTVDGIGVVLNSLEAGTTGNGDDRVFHVVEAGKSAIGVAYSLAQPLPARLGAEPIRAMPGRTPELERARLRAAEALLQRGATRADFKFTPWPHLGNAVLNLAGGTIIWALGDRGDAALSAGIGFAAGELRIWTSPTQPPRDLVDYRARYGELAAPADAGWSLQPRPNGVALALRF